MWPVVRNELVKLFRFKKIYIYTAILLGFALLMAAGALAIQSTPELAESAAGPNPLLTLNATSYPLWFLGMVSDLILPLFFIILVAGMFSEEYGKGTLKLSLLYKVTRARLVLGKMITLAVAIVIMLVLVYLIALGIGTIFLDSGPLNLMGQSVQGGTASVLAAYSLYGLFLLSYSLTMMALAQFFASSGATIGIGLGVQFGLSIIGGFFSKIAPYLLTSHYGIYTFLFMPVDTGDVMRSFAVVTIYALAGTAFTIWYFNRKDLIH